jgi:hypothetical protein
VDTRSDERHGHHDNHGHRDDGRDH